MGRRLAVGGYLPYAVRSGARPRLRRLAACLVATVALATAAEPPGDGALTVTGRQPAPGTLELARERFDGGEPSAEGGRRYAGALVSVADYLAAFAETYRSPLAEREDLAHAEAAVLEAALSSLPRLSLRERLDLAAGGPELALGLDVRVPLFDATAAPRQASAAAELELRTLHAVAAREAALASLLHDLAALAVLAPAAEQAEELASRAAAVAAAADPLPLPADRREAYEASWQVGQAARWLVAVKGDAARRLSRRLVVNGLALIPPPPAELERALAASFALAERAGARLGLEEAVAACVAGSTAARVAHARHAQASRAAELDRAPELTVTLSGRLDGTLPLAGGLGAGGAHATATLGLEASLLLPRGWPLGGSLSAGANAGGAFQELQVSWPPGRSGPSTVVDAGEQLADELDLIADEARALLRSLAAARTEREVAERALAWALLDRSLALGPARAKALAASPWGPGWQELAPEHELALTRLRLEAALGRLGELAAAIDVARHCGLLPAAGPG